MKVWMRKKNIILSILFLVVIMIFTTIFFIKISRLKSSVYFAWMDAYIASEVNSENSITLTYFFEKEPFSIEDVVAINFSDSNEAISIENYSFSEVQTSKGNLKNRAITIDFVINKVGIYETDGIDLSFNDGTIIYCPVGDWTFDSNESIKEIVNTWSGPAASSNGDEFVYEYSLNDSDAVVTEIYVGKDFYINNDDGNILSGVIDISNEFEAPIVYIKSKIKVSLEGNAYINSGHGCYCGAFDFDEEFFNMSEEKNSIYYH